MFTIELLNEGRDETWRTLVIDLRKNLEAIITTLPLFESKEPLDLVIFNQIAKIHVHHLSRQLKKQSSMRNRILPC